GQFTIRWYSGESGDTSRPRTLGSSEPSYALKFPTHGGLFWARIEGGGRTIDTETIPVTVQTQTIELTDRIHFDETGEAGVLWAMGENDAAQLGDASREFRSQPVPVFGNVTGIRGAPGEAVFETADGSLWFTGETLRRSHELGLFFNHWSGLPLRLSAPEQPVFRLLDPGRYLDSEGVVRPLPGGETPIAMPSWIEPDTPIHDYRLMYYRAVVLYADGRLFFDNSFGSILYPARVAVADRVVAIATGDHHLAYLRDDGTCWIFGYDKKPLYHHQDGTVTLGSQRLLAGQIRSIAVAGANTYFVRNDGVLYGYGPAHPELTDVEVADHWTPVPLANSTVAVAAADQAVYFLTESGDLYGLGEGHPGLAGELELDPSTPHRIDDEVVAFSATDGNLFYIRAGDMKPIINHHPVSQRYTRGHPPALITHSSGTIDSLQWFTINADGLPQPIEGAVDPVYQPPSSDSPQEYFLRISYPGGFVDSNTAVLTPVDTVFKTGNRPSTSLFPGPLRVIGGLQHFGFDRTVHAIENPMVFSDEVVAQHSADMAFFYLTPDGELYGMGPLTTEIGGPAPAQQAKRLATDVLRFSGTRSQLLVVDTENRLWARGRNYTGSLGLGSENYVLDFEMVTDGVHDVVTTGRLTLILKLDGSLWVAGLTTFTDYGQESRVMRKPTLLQQGVSRIHAAEHACYWLDLDHNLWGIGLLNAWFLDVSAEEAAANRYQATTRPTLLAENVQSFSNSGLQLTYVTSDGQAWSIGLYRNRYLGNPEEVKYFHEPRLLLPGAHEIFTHDSRTLILDRAGRLWGVGSFPVQGPVHAELRIFSEPVLISEQVASMTSYRSIISYTNFGETGGMVDSEGVPLTTSLGEEGERTLMVFIPPETRMLELAARSESEPLTLTLSETNETESGQPNSWTATGILAALRIENLQPGWHSVHILGPQANGEIELRALAETGPPFDPAAPRPELLNLS
ncbi:MAG: hypothetical protein EA425_11715, partial [Puniceicoccaceae bacterium]